MHLTAALSEGAEPAAEPGDKVTAVLPALGSINRDNWERNTASLLFSSCGSEGSQREGSKGRGQELAEGSAMGWPCPGRGRPQPPVLAALVHGFERLPPASLCSACPQNPGPVAGC